MSNNRLFIGTAVILILVETGLVVSTKPSASSPFELKSSGDERVPATSTSTTFPTDLATDAEEVSMVSPITFPEYLLDAVETSVKSNFYPPTKMHRDSPNKLKDFFDKGTANGDAKISPPVNSSSSALEVEYLDLKLVLIPRRTLRASWSTSDLSDVYCFCLTIAEKISCSETSSTEIEVEVPAGIVIIARAFAITPDDSSSCSSMLQATTGTATTRTTIPKSIPNNICVSDVHRKWKSSRVWTTDVNNSGSKKSLKRMQANAAVKEEIIYIPWQLLIGDSTTSSLMVEWTPGEYVTDLCWSKRPSQVKYYEECRSMHESNYVIRGLIPSQEYEIALCMEFDKSLVIYASTRALERYRSRVWQCEAENWCNIGEACFPTTRGLLLPETDPAQVNVPSTYRHTCINETAHLTKSCDIIAGHNGQQVAIGHAAFVDFTDGQDLPFCSLSNALALYNYWCNGKFECQIECEQLHSYFRGSDGCQNTDISSFSLSYLNTTLERWECDKGAHMYEKYLSCFAVPDFRLVPFDAARRKCQSLGGDVLYIYQGSNFFEFLTKNLSVTMAFWSLGDLGTNLVTRPPMLYSTTVDKAYVTIGSNEFDIDFCSNGCNDMLALTVCTLPPLYQNFFFKLHKGSKPNSCISEACQNGGTCFPVSYSPGLPGNESSYMCRCRDGYSGLRCEWLTDSHEELLAPSNGLYEIRNDNIGLSIEYAYFGRYQTSNFLGCYSPGALALLRLKCENQKACSISHRDLHNHLSSTCHPDIPPQLTVRISSHPLGTKIDCEHGGELYEPTGTCFALTSNKFTDAQKAKEACNSLGGDLAYPYNDLQLCLEGDFSAWADGSQQPHSPNFDMVVGDVAVLTCGDPSSDLNKPALCEFPSLSSVPDTAPDCPKAIPFPDVYPDYSWGPATPATLVSQKCPNGTDVSNADVTWFCGYLGMWMDLPDMSLCRTLDLREWISELNNTSSGTTAGDTLGRLAANLTSNLAPGDILGLVDLIELAKARHKLDLTNASGSDQAVFNISGEYTSSVTNISSVVLEEPSIWAGIPWVTRYPTASTLQENVETAVVEISLLLKNRTEIYNFSTISVLAQQHPYHYFNESTHRTFSHPKYTASRVSLPADFYHDLPNKGKIAVTFTAFNTLHCVLSSDSSCLQNSEDDDIIMDGIVNTPIMGMTIGNTSWSALPSSEGVIATFSHFYTNVYNISNAECVWWDLVNNSWSTKNCSLIQTTKSETICSCDHLTNLAVIVDVNGKLSEEILRITQWITIIGCSISLTCLCFAILTLATMLGKIKHSSKRTSVIHLNFCCCLFAAEVVLLAGLDATYNEIGCGVVAGLLHYLLLATFCWMGVESFNVYRMLIKVFDNEKSFMKLYYAFAYGIPVIIVGISLGVTQTKGYGTERYCWLDPEIGLTWAFAAPALLILLNNLVIFGLSLKVLRKFSFSEVQAGGTEESDKIKEDRAKRNEEKRRNNVKMIKVSFTLAITMGITWILGFLILFEGLEWVAIIFTTVNSLHGVGLFVVLIMFPARPRAHFLNIMPFKPKKKGTRFFEAWYPYGEPGEYNQISSTEDTHSYYYQGSSFRWSERLSSGPIVSEGGVPRIPRASIDYSSRTSKRQSSTADRSGELQFSVTKSTIQEEN